MSFVSYKILSESLNPSCRASHEDRFF